MEDVPHEFLDAMAHADRVLLWEEHLSEEETPPVWMWPLHWEVDPWLRKVMLDRKEKYGGSDDSTDFDSDEYLVNEDLPDWAK